MCFSFLDSVIRAKTVAFGVAALLSIGSLSSHADSGHTGMNGFFVWTVESDRAFNLSVHEHWELDRDAYALAQGLIILRGDEIVQRTLWVSWADSEHLSLNLPSGAHKEVYMTTHCTVYSVMTDLSGGFLPDFCKFDLNYTRTLEPGDYRVIRIYGGVARPPTISFSGNPQPRLESTGPATFLDQTDFDGFGVSVTAGIPSVILVSNASKLLNVEYRLFGMFVGHSDQILEMHVETPAGLMAGETAYSFVNAENGDYRFVIDQEVSATPLSFPTFLLAADVDVPASSRGG